MVAGRQNVWFNPQSMSLEPVLSAYPDEWNETINVILSKVVTEISRFTSFGPIAQVLPQDGSQHSALAARAGKLILQNNYFNYGLNFQGMYARAALWDITMGHVFLKTTWDAFGGKAWCEYDMEPDMLEIALEAQKEGETFDQELTEFLQNPEGEVTGENEKLAQDEKEQTTIGESDVPPQIQMPGQQPSPQTVPAPPGVPSQTLKLPKLDDKGEPIMKHKLDANGNKKINGFGYEGKVRKEAVSPLNILYDPAVTDFMDLPDIIHTEYKSIADVRANYPNCEDITDADRETNSLNPWEMIYKLEVDRNPNGQNAGINVYEYWSKATEDFPQGLRMIIIKNKVRLALPMDVLEGERLPFSHAFYHDLGTMRGMGMPEKLRGGQRNLNKLYNQYVRNTELFEVPHLLMRDDTRFNEVPTNEGTTIWRYTGTQEPKPWTPTSIGQAHFQLMEFTDNFIDQLSHINKLAEGQVQPNVTSAEMMQTALEANYQANNMELNRFTWMIADSCELELRYIQAKANKRILIKFIGQDGKLIVDDFDNSIIKGQLSVSMPPGQIGNNSRAQQASDLKTFLPLILQGQVDDPDMKRIFMQKVLDFLDWGEETRTISELNRQQNYARSWINEIKNSQDNPNFNVQTLVGGQPFIDLKTWKEEVEGILLDKEEFESWQPDPKQRLMNLWVILTQSLTQIQLQAAQQMQNQAPPPVPGVPPKPGMPQVPPRPPGPPAMGGMPPMPGGKPPGHMPGHPSRMGPKIKLQQGANPSIIQRRVPQLAQPEALNVPTQEPANA